MNNTKIPGEHLRKELITNHYGNDFLNDFANTIIQNIPDQGEVRRINYAAKIIEIKIITKSTHAIDFYGYISDALLNTISIHASEHLSKEALNELAAMSLNLSYLFNATLTNTSVDNAILTISL